MIHCIFLFVGISLSLTIDDIKTGITNLFKLESCPRFENLTSKIEDNLKSSMITNSPLIPHIVLDLFGQDDVIFQIVSAMKFHNFEPVQKRSGKPTVFHL